MRRSMPAVLAAALGLIFVLSVVGYPLVAALSQSLDIPNRWVSVPFRALVLALSLFAIGYFALLRWPRGVHVFWLVWWAFWALYLARLLVDAFLNPDALKLPLGEYALYVVGVSLVPAAALSFERPAETARRWPTYLIAMGTAGIALNLWIVFYQRDFSSFLELAGTRAETDALDPISAGHLAVTVAILCCWKWLTDERPGLGRSLLLGACCLIALGGLVASASRGPALALAMVLGVMLLTVGKRAVVLVGVVAAAIGAFAFAVGTIALEGVYIFDRVSTSMFYDAQRTALLQRGVDLVVDNPLIGGGIEPLATYPHNVLLESFMVLGIFSGLSFSILFFYSLWIALRVIVFDRRSGWLALLFLQYAASAMVSGSLYTVSVLWVLMAALVSHAVGAAGKDLHAPVTREDSGARPVRA